MSVLRSDRSAFLKAEVTKDGLIKTQQVVRNPDGSIPDISLSDPGKVYSKDIMLKQYKGLVYALPAPGGGTFVTISYPSNMSKNYLVDKRDSVKVD